MLHKTNKSNSENIYYLKFTLRIFKHAGKMIQLWIMHRQTAYREMCKPEISN